MDEDDDFADAPAGGRPRPRRAQPSTRGLQQHPATVRRMCELGREALTHQQISAALHAEGLLNSRGGRWTRTTDGKVIERVLGRNSINLRRARPRAAALVPPVPAAATPASLSAPASAPATNEVGGDHAPDELMPQLAVSHAAPAPVHDLEQGRGAPHPANDPGASDVASEVPAASHAASEVPQHGAVADAEADSASEQPPERSAPRSADNACVDVDTAPHAAPAAPLLHGAGGADSDEAMKPRPSRREQPLPRSVPRAATRPHVAAPAATAPAAPRAAPVAPLHGAGDAESAPEQSAAGREQQPVRSVPRPAYNAGASALAAPAAAASHAAPEVPLHGAVADVEADSASEQPREQSAPRPAYNVAAGVVAATAAAHTPAADTAPRAAPAPAHDLDEQGRGAPHPAENPGTSAVAAEVPAAAHAAPATPLLHGAGDADSAPASPAPRGEQQPVRSAPCPAENPVASAVATAAATTEAMPATLHAAFAPVHDLDEQGQDAPHSANNAGASAVATATAAAASHVAPAPLYSLAAALVLSLGGDVADADPDEAMEPRPPRRYEPPPRIAPRAAARPHVAAPVAAAVPAAVDTDSDDAMEQRRPRRGQPTPRSRPGANANGAAAAVRTGTAKARVVAKVAQHMLQGALCPQCTGLFAATGRHQACSLSCGHIFGCGCITVNLGRHKSCPLCGKSAKKAQIRPLYATAEVKKAAVGPDWKPGCRRAQSRRWSSVLNANSPNYTRSRYIN
ncbi:hypothetical protein T492DRAFT_957367, partial [Pavlovales sp. CCMP2436]